MSASVSDSKEKQNSSSVDAKSILKVLFWALFFSVQIWLPVEFLSRDMDLDFSNRYAWTMFDGHEPTGIKLFAFNGEQTIEINRTSPSHSGYSHFQSWRLITCARLEFLGYNDYYLDLAYDYAPSYIQQYVGQRKLCPERDFEKPLKRTPVK